MNKWFGYGWQVIDPDTGAAGYLIAGYLTSGNVTITAGGAGSQIIYAAMIPDFLLDIVEKLLHSLDPAAAIGAIISTFLVRCWAISFLGLSGISLLIFTIFAAVAIYLLIAYVLIRTWRGGNFIRRRWSALAIIK